MNREHPSYSYRKELNNKIVISLNQGRRNDMAGRIGARFGLTLALVLLAIGAWVAGQGSTIAAVDHNFVGKPPLRVDVSDVRAMRLRFEPGARSNWHEHGGFQVIMAEEGRGLTQVRGEPVEEMLPGVPHYVGPGVAHWHGAAPDEPMIQLAVMGGDGPTHWLEPVSDKDYPGRQAGVPHRRAGRGQR